MTKIDFQRDVFGANDDLMAEVNRIEKAKRLLEQNPTGQEYAIDTLVAASYKLMLRAWGE
jgi:hypothetical protein